MDRPSKHAASANSIFNYFFYGGMSMAVHVNTPPYSYIPLNF